MWWGVGKGATEVLVGLIDCLAVGCSFAFLPPAEVVTLFGFLTVGLMVCECATHLGLPFASITKIVVDLRMES